MFDCLSELLTLLYRVSELFPPATPDRYPKGRE